MRRRIGFSDKLEDCCESDWSTEERQRPETEGLVHCDVETETLGIVRCAQKDISHLCPDISYSTECVRQRWPIGEVHLPMLSIVSSIRGLIILYHRYMFQINHLEPLKLPVRQKG